jgi:hypothetical protein
MNEDKKPIVVVSQCLGFAAVRYNGALLEDYGRARRPLSALISLMQSWIARFDREYLARQSYFEPYPRALLSLTDSASATGEEQRAGRGTARA